MMITDIRNPKPHRHNIRKDRGFDYQSPQWRTTRNAFIAANHMCKCGAKATVADHKVRIKDGGDPYAWSNLQPKCQKCHDSKDNNAGRK